MTTHPGDDQLVWSAGTLRYTRRALLGLFCWLLCNDLCLMLLEQVAPQLTPLLLKGWGASNHDLALYMSTLTGTFTIWINPVVSTWSDRHRGPYGRRRPFLFFAAPGCAILLAMLPFTPQIAAFLGLHGARSEIMIIGICYVVYTFFNSVVLALFMYYFWDVVPESLLGRFTSLTKIVTTVALFLWNYFFFGMAEKHTREICVGIAVFFLVVYLTSLWHVREGEYPDPAPSTGHGFFGEVRSYFTECYTDPYYLWFFCAGAAYQISGFTNLYQIFYYRDELGLSLDTIGKMRSWPSLAIVLLAYPLGVLIDRLNPMRIVAPALLFWSLVNLGSFFFLRGAPSLLISVSLVTIASFIYSVSYGVMNVEVFPRARLGQFCSANAIFYQVIGLVAGMPIGMLFDYLKDYRYIFLWSACFQAGAAALFVKVYYNWKHRHPTPQIELADAVL